MRVGKMNLDNRSLLIGMAVAMVGLCAKPTQSFFASILQSISNLVASLPVIGNGGKK